MVVAPDRLRLRRLARDLSRPPRADERAAAQRLRLQADFEALLPEYLRAFADYRMLVFGAVLVAMMVFRPQGLVTGVRRTYTSGR